MSYYWKVRPDGETDITRRFGRRVLGSIPGRGTRNENMRRGIMSPGGYGSMVEHLVANQMMGVRFSLPAPNMVFNAKMTKFGHFCVKKLLWQSVDKPVHTVDKGQVFLLDGNGRLYNISNKYAVFIKAFDL